jgi:uncharacterized protein
MLLIFIVSRLPRTIRRISMNYITSNDLEALALGAGILGSGGGGDPAIELLLAQHILEQYGPVRLVSPSSLCDNDIVAPVAFMGAPLVSVEKIPSGKEATALIARLEHTLGIRPTVLMAGEIGGANAFTPLIMAGLLNLPVLDADTLGRAFPELQMSSCNLYGVSASPAVLADSLGNTTIITASNACTIERIARYSTIAMGSSVAVSLYTMTGKQARSAVVPHTLTQACALGKIILEARANSQNPVHALVTYTDAVHLGSGIVNDIDHAIKDGFLRGKFRILMADTALEVVYQNENLIVYVNGHVSATTPDIIIPVQAETGAPLSCNALRYGMRVAVLVFPAPDVWKTAKGLELVGPRSFGYDINYIPVHLRNKRK